MSKYLGKFYQSLKSNFAIILTIFQTIFLHKKLCAHFCRLQHNFIFRLFCNRIGQIMKWKGVKLPKTKKFRSSKNLTDFD